MVLLQSMLVNGSCSQSPVEDSLSTCGAIGIGFACLCLVIVTLLLCGFWVWCAAALLIRGCKRGLLLSVSGSASGFVVYSGLDCPTLCLQCLEVSVFFSCLQRHFCSSK